MKHLCRTNTEIHLMIVNEEMQRWLFQLCLRDNNKWKTLTHSCFWKKLQSKSNKMMTDSAFKQTLLKLRTLVLSKTEIYSCRRNQNPNRQIGSPKCSKRLWVKRADFLHLKNLKLYRRARTDVVCQKRRRSRLVLKWFLCLKLKLKNYKVREIEFKTWKQSSKSLVKNRGTNQDLFNR